MIEEGNTIEGWVWWGREKENKMMSNHLFIQLTFTEYCYMPDIELAF